MIPDLEARILYEADGLLVVNKPHDLPSTGRTLDDDDCLQYWLIKRHGTMVWAIHQLDADTSGVNLFTTDKTLVPIYKKALEKNNAEKTYLAIIKGNPNWTTIEEFSPIGKVDSRSLGVIESGKAAHTEFSVLDRNRDYALLKVTIYSGRTHQIRIHLAHLGYPLVGEEWYTQPPCKIHPRQALHCYQIKLPQVDKCFMAPLAPDLEELLSDLGLRKDKLSLVE